MSIINSAPKVQGGIAAEYRAKQDNIDRLRLENLIEKTNPKNIDALAKGAADREIPKKAPRYRGSTTVADHANTGIIDGKKMNKGDYIMYGGVTEGAWIKARMYEWNGAEWRLLEIVDNRWKYLDGINDLTEGALEGVFSNAFIQTLITKTAIIDQLFSKQITLHENGVIQSENYAPGVSGFIIGHS
jgi:hypothetical protein